MRNLLIATMGLAPGVVTGAYFALERENRVQLDKVISVTTSHAAAGQCELLVRRTLQTADPAPVYQPIRAINGTELSSSEMALRFTRRIERLLEDEVPQHEAVYLVLTGGRTSMAAAMLLALQKFSFDKSREIFERLKLFHLETLDEEFDRRGQMRELALMLPAEQEKFLNPPDQAIKLVQIPFAPPLKDNTALQARIFEFAAGAYLMEKGVCQDVLYSFEPDYLKQEGLGEVDIFAKKATNDPIEDIEEVDWLALHDLVCRSFTMSDLNDLCFQLGVNQESIAGETIEARARNLIQYFHRRGQLKKLVEKFRQERPRRLWHDAVFLRQLVVCECKLRIKDPEQKPIEVGVVQKLIRKVEAIHKKEKHPVQGWVITNTPYADPEALQLAKDNQVEMRYAKLPANWQEQTNWHISSLDQPLQPPPA